ncbi:MAG: hypothetical protein OXE40_03610, partial [Gammaproteobacteria bacterium]|nr:hypothetical protein [Gammaproteobacteria bacterium]
MVRNSLLPRKSHQLAIANADARAPRARAPSRRLDALTTKVGGTCGLVLLVATATASAVAEPPAGDNDRVRIDTMVVTGTRIEQTTAETGSTVRIIDADEIAALGFSHALDAVATAPGVTVNQNGSFGGSAT